MSSELVKLNENAMVESPDFDLKEFEGVELSTQENKELYENDIMLPKIWLIQALSELRKQKKAEEGQFVDSQTGEILAPEGGEVRFVVLKTFKKWQTFELVTEGGKNKKKYMNTEIMTLENAKLPYEETVEGKKIVRRQVVSAYVLLERDFAAKKDKPYIVDFAGSSKYGGRKLISDINTLEKEGYPSFVAWFKMTAHEETFEDGDAFVRDTAFGGYMTKEDIPFLKSCYNNLKSIEDQIVIDDSDVIVTESTTKTETNVSNQIDNQNAGI